MKTRTFIVTALAVHARTIAATRQLIFRRACLWTGILAFAMIAFGPPPAQAAVTEAWVHRFSNVLSNVTDEAVKVVRDAAGDIIVTGTTGGDMLTIKYSGADGSVLWQQRYNSPANGYDQASALAVDGSGNVVVTGSSQRESGSWEYEIYTAKYAATDGALLWERRGPDIFYAPPYPPANLAVDGNGNVVVTGSSNGDYYTAKYAATDGALLWESFSGPANNDDYPKALAVDGNGNVVVTGFSYTSGYSDYYTAKYAAADGELLWEQAYSGPTNSYGRAKAVAVDGSGNVFVAGYSYGSGGNLDYATIAYSGAGVPLWTNRCNGARDYEHIVNAVAVDASGNVFVTGTATLAYSGAGVPLWTNRYDGSGNGPDIANAVAVDGSGNVVVTGHSSNDYYTAKYAAADGELLWEKRSNGPANGYDYDQANAVAVDGSGNVVVTGYSYSSSADVDYYTAK